MDRTELIITVAKDLFIACNGRDKLIRLGLSDFGKVVKTVAAEVDSLTTNEPDRTTKE